jgi:hypothetical protein
MEDPAEGGWAQKWRVELALIVGSEGRGRDKCPLEAVAQMW